MTCLTFIFNVKYFLIFFVWNDCNLVQNVYKYKKRVKYIKEIQVYTTGCPCRRTFEVTINVFKSNMSMSPLKSTCRQ